MIPILYEKTEINFTTNGLGRLRDCISCVVTEERNGIYECNFEYPVDGAHFEDIKLGRIIGVEHDETNDVQPFDIVGYTRPINGIVEFHCAHISYRQSKMTVYGTNINSLASAFTMLSGAKPSNPFTYWTDKTSTGYMSSADGTPYSVRQMLGGVEGSILDAYGGEYEWDKFAVKLWARRGKDRELTIRYGVNMLDYTDETDDSESYNAMIPFWKGQNAKGADIVVRGSMVSSGQPSVSGRTECVPMDFTDKFETKPTTAQLNNMATSYMSSNQTYLPAQTITVDFIRLADTAEYAKLAKLQECKLCDTIKVVFPSYKQTGTFKIVKTEYDVLLERFTSMELGDLSTSLAEALGISSGESSSSKRDEYNLIAVRGVELASSGSIPANGVMSGTIVTDVSASVPAGYKIIYANLRGTQNQNTVCWYCGYTDTTVSYRLRNLSSSAVTTSPTANLLCAPV